MAGGLFNLFLQGQGIVAVTSDGPPLLLDCSRQPTFVDPQAAVCWSANLTPQLKSSFKMGSLIGRGSGESFQLGFHGPRSEEHTSELQSRGHLVCRLLLEK